MNKIIYIFVGSFVTLHGALEASRYFWRNWIVELPPPTWPPAILVVLGLVLFSYPFTKGLSWLPRKSLLWLLGTFVVLIELWLMLEPLGLARLHPTLIMGVISIVGVTLVCIRETSVQHGTAI